MSRPMFEKFLEDNPNIAEKPDGDAMAASLGFSLPKANERVGWGRGAMGGRAQLTGFDRRILGQQCATSTASPKAPQAIRDFARACAATLATCGGGADGIGEDHRTPAHPSLCRAHKHEAGAVDCPGARSSIPLSPCGGLSRCSWWAMGLQTGAIAQRSSRTERRTRRKGLRLESTAA